MNIFYVDRNPIVAAQSLHDKHVVKMVLETAQLLSTAHHEHGNPQGLDRALLLKATHVNHPSNVWCRNRWENYDWLASHGIALANEYKHRYARTHDLEDMIIVLASYYPMMDDLKRTDPPQCMPDKYKQISTVEAYRAYYRGEKLTYTRGMKTYKNRWTNREKPAWLTTSDTSSA